MNLLTEAVANATVVSSLSNVTGEIVATINGVAPTAITVMGVFLVWKAGIKFFKTLTKA